MTRTFIGCRRSFSALAAAAGWWLYWLGGTATSFAQIAPDLSNGQFELSEAVELDRADSTVTANLQRAQAHLADRQWSEGIETIRQVMENSGAALLSVSPHRYVSVRDYCQLQLAGLPAEPLALYRSLVDPLAQKTYEEGVATLNRQALRNVVEQSFASAWGDRALLALGDMALEAGDYASARWYWERIFPVRPPAGTTATWLAYPDTRLDLAAVRARLVLVSIMEGSTARARDELAQFARLHHDARGVLGGEDVNWAQALSTQLAASATWPKPKPSPDWPTFAGSPARDKTVPETIDPGKVVWRVGIAEPAANRPAAIGLRAQGVAEDVAAPLSYYPVVVGNLVLVANRSEILALDLATGRPAWGGASAAIYREAIDDAPASMAEPADHLGVARHTLTVCDGRVYAHMGSSLTARSQAAVPTVRPGSLVCVDLQTQGRLLWKVAPEEGWAFEGAPLVAGADVYVAMRRSDIRPQAHVACLDAQSGAIRWRRFVCAAETPARGMLNQLSHNLLTLHRDTLYYNTNLGAIAALAARDGQLQWVALYPRVRQGDLAHLAPHWQRDLNPCLYYRGTLLAAPADSPSIFALDAASGQILWQTGPEVEDAVHLLGVGDDCLVAGGDRLYWISLSPATPGKILRVWPESGEKLGYGRGLLAGGAIYWPMRGRIARFNLKTAAPEQVIDLAPRGTMSGNLAFAAGYLLIATPRELVALEADGGRPAQPPALRDHAVPFTFNQIRNPNVEILNKFESGKSQ